MYAVFFGTDRNFTRENLIGRFVYQQTSASSFVFCTSLARLSGERLSKPYVVFLEDIIHENGVLKNFKRMYITSSSQLDHIPLLSQVQWTEG